MAVSQTFRIQRVSLSAGVRTAITPPATFKSLAIDNGTTGDLTVYTNDDESEYLVISAGYGRTIPVEQHRFSPSETACWLKAASSGTAVILWT
jgi:hypothetical protein